MAQRTLNWTDFWKRGKKGKRKKRIRIGKFIKYFYMKIYFRSLNFILALKTFRWSEKFWKEVTSQKQKKKKNSICTYIYDSLSNHN
jgi:hypothetical protein